MEILTFENVISKTIELFPDYAATRHYADNDKELTYSFFYGFVEYINNHINQSDDPVSDGEVKKAFKLFNEMVYSKDEQLSTLAVTEVFENLVQSKKSKEVTLKLLNAEGLKYLHEVLKSTGVQD